MSYFLMSFLNLFIEQTISLWSMSRSLSSKSTCYKSSLIIFQAKLFSLLGWRCFISSPQWPNQFSNLHSLNILTFLNGGHFGFKSYKNLSQNLANKPMFRNFLFTKKVAWVNNFIWCRSQKKVSSSSFLMFSKLMVNNWSFDLLSTICPSQVNSSIS